MKNKILFLLTLVTLTSTQAMFNDQNERNKEMDKNNSAAAKEWGLILEQTERAQRQAEEERIYQAQREEKNILFAQEMAEKDLKYKQNAEKREVEAKELEEKWKKDADERRRLLDLKKAQKKNEMNNEKN